MPQRSGPVHVVTTTRHYNGKVYQSHLLRRSYRDGPHVRNETLGNLSHLPDALIDIIRRALKGETFVPAAQTFEIVASHAHGHVQAVTAAMKRLGLAPLIASRPCRERDLVLAMIAARVLDAAPKLATVRWWKTTTLPQTFAVEDADEQDLYGAWTGYWRARTRSRSSSPHVISTSAAPWLSTTSPPATPREPPVPWPGEATAATASAGPFRSTMAC